MKTLTRSTLTILTLAACFFAAPNQAQAADPVFNDEGAIVTYKGGTRELSFVEGDTLEGEVLRFDGANLYSTRGRHHASLIPIKFHFIPELITMTWDAPSPF